MTLDWWQADGAWIDGEIVPEVAVGVDVESRRIERVARGADAARIRGARRVAGILLPGAIDLQVNGAGGRGVEEATSAALDEVARAARAGGASAFLPTLITAPRERLLERISAVATWVESRRDPRAGRATPLGLHVEGPFLELPGAHPPEHCIDPTPELVEALLAAGRGHVRLVTLAPDRTGAVDAVRRLAGAGVRVALGHARGVERFDECVAAGASLVTHLYNAMSPLHHRTPGVVGRTLVDERLSASLILDGHHVSREAALVAWRCLGPGRTLLVTDAVSAAGMPDGEYSLSGTPVRLSGGAVRDASGRLAGSALTMAGAVAGLRELAPGIGAGAVARVTSENPARLLGDEERGALRAGAPAEMALLAPDGTFSALLP